MRKERASSSNLDLLIVIGEKAKEIKENKEALDGLNARLQIQGDLLRQRKRESKHYYAPSSLSFMFIEDDDLYEPETQAERLKRHRGALEGKKRRYEPRTVSSLKTNRTPRERIRALKNLSDLPIGDIFIDYRQRLTIHTGKVRSCPSQCDYEGTKAGFGVHPADDV